jgi:UDP-GlcNAc3NAcA epimerase
MKVLSIVGARPQFIKAAAVSRVLRDKHQEILVHTGQHYDQNMSEIFFRELDIPEPDINLNVGSGDHGFQTGKMLARIERVLKKERPDLVLVYGDTNSTLAGALAAAKLHIRVAHVEAGLRSFNRLMPEEINRIIADHLSDLLFCPSQTSVDNLAAEGIKKGVHLVGDVMADALIHVTHHACTFSNILDRYNLTEKEYLLATVHRPENTDDPTRLMNILTAFSRIEEKIIFPVHPRTRQKIVALSMDQLWPSLNNLMLVDPLGFLDMVRLEQGARLILTDSGGIQKEAYWLAVPCITLRDETEWVETVETGWNLLTGSDAERIIEAVYSFCPNSAQQVLYGDGKASNRIISLI